MPIRDSRPEFRELRTFAGERIPGILKEGGGRLDKSALHRQVEQEFRNARGRWPKELDTVDQNGRRRATNAIAWALSALTQRGTIQPCTRSELVIFRRAKPPRSSGNRARNDAGRATSDRAENLENFVRAAARGAISRGRRLGLPVDVGFVEESVRAVRGAGYRCAISGRPFDTEYRTQGAGGRHFAPSPDRIVPELGYVNGNVRWILWCLNRGKGEMPGDDFLEVCRLVGKAPKGH